MQLVRSGQGGMRRAPEAPRLRSAAGKLGTRQSARGIAAGLVVLFHAGTTLQSQAAGAALPWQILAFGLASAAVIYGVVQLEMSSSLRSPAVLQYFGDASYSIYLIHGPTLGVATGIALEVLTAEALPVPLLCLVLSGLAILGGLVFHHVCESPLLSGLHAIFGRPGRAP